MIIIKIIILYFIQIRHTDDFPSAGIPASHYKGAIVLSTVYSEFVHSLRTDRE